MPDLDAVALRELERAARSFDYPHAFAGSAVLITGATGFLGSQLAHFFSCLSKIFGLGVKLQLLVRDESKARAMFEGRLDIPFSIGANFSDFDSEETNYLFHCASVTTSRLFVERPVETIHAALFLTDEALRLARRKNSRMVYLSSMEVFGKICEDHALKENEYGYIDILSLRSSYPESKRLCECLCASYAAEYGVDVCIGRLSQTFGPGIDRGDPRVMAEFCRCVLESRDIVLKTDGASVRSCCCSTDAVTALAVLACNGRKGEAYNIANPEMCQSIRETAEFVCSRYPQVNLRFELDDTAPYPPASRLCLDSSRLEALGWKARTGLREMFELALESMREAL